MDLDLLLILAFLWYRCTTLLQNPHSPTVVSLVGHFPPKSYFHLLKKQSFLYFTNHKTVCNQQMSRAKCIISPLLADFLSAIYFFSSFSSLIKKKIIFRLFLSFLFFIFYLLFLLFYLIFLSYFFILFFNLFFYLLFLSSFFYLLFLSSFFYLLFLSSFFSSLSSIFSSYKTFRVPAIRRMLICSLEQVRTLWIEGPLVSRRAPLEATSSSAAAYPADKYLPPPHFHSPVSSLS